MPPDDEVKDLDPPDTDPAVPEAADSTRGTRSIEDRVIELALAQGLLSGEDLAAVAAELPSTGDDPSRQRLGTRLDRLVRTGRLTEKAVSELVGILGAMDSSPSEFTMSLPRSVPATELPPLQQWERYELLEKLGQGGMGTVYRARDRALHREVAVKFLLSVDPESRQRLFQEARALARIDHPHICKVYEVGEVQGRDYIAMQLLTGVSLATAGPGMSLRERVAVMLTVARAIHAAHQIGIIHRDIKPSNIMIDRPPDGRLHPTVMDFGLARDIAGGTLTATNVVLGSPPYMAPEQASASRHLDVRTDVYGLGATLYDLAVGKPPFNPEIPTVIVMHAVLLDDPPAPRSLVPTLPKDLETIILKCLSKDPHRRYQSALALAEDLQRYLNGEPVLGQRTSRIHRIIRKVRRHRALAVVLGMAATWSIGLGAYGLRSVYLTRRQASLSVELGQQLKTIEWLLRVVHALPLHDTRPEQRLVRNLMKDIAVKRSQLGDWSQGPVDDALGRGHLLLRDFAQAAERLRLAMREGVDTPELHQTLGLVLGAQYEQALAETRHRGDLAWRERQRQQLTRAYLEPALTALEKSRALQGASPHLLVALIAYYREQHDLAEAEAARVLAETPWVYEAHLLQGHTRRARAQASLDQGAYEAARSGFTQALRHYQQAADIARSDATVYEAIADALLGQAEADWRQGRAQTVLDDVLATCDKALAIDPTRLPCHLKKARAYWLRVHDVPLAGGTPRAVLDASLAAARRAVEIDPQNARAHDALGNAYTDLALNLWNQGSDPEPSWTAARTAFERAIDLEPDFPWALNDLGVLYRTWGLYRQDRGPHPDPRPEYALAIQSYRRALQKDPQFLYACSNLVDLHAELADHTARRGQDPRADVDAAVREGERCLAIDHNFHTVLADMARAELTQADHLLASGQDPAPLLDRARTRLEELRRLTPNDLRTHLFFAALYEVEARHRLRAGQDPQASSARGQQALAEATRRVPMCGDCEIVRARLHRTAAAWALRTGQPARPSLEAAHQAAQRAVKFVPDNAEAQQELGETRAALATAGPSPPALTELDASLQAITHALDLHPWLARMRAIRARLLRMRAERLPTPAARQTALEAQRDLQEALTSNPLLEPEYRTERARLDDLLKE